MPIMRKFIDYIYFWAEHYKSLPDKFIDTKLVIFLQLLICVFLYACILSGQLSVINRCAFPVPSSFIR